MFVLWYYRDEFIIKVISFDEIYLQIVYIASIIAFRPYCSMVDSNFFRVLVILLLTAALLFFKLIILVLTVWVVRAESKGRPPSAIPFGQIHTKLPNSTPLLRFARSISLPRIRKMLPILQFNNICSFFTIIYFTRSASFDKAKFLQDESHVLTSALQRL